MNALALTNKLLKRNRIAADDIPVFTHPAIIIAHLQYKKACFFEQPFAKVGVPGGEWVGTATWIY